MRGRLSINQSAMTVPGVLRQGRSEVLRLKGVFMIHQLREQGLTVSEIARRMRVDRKTVRRYLQYGVEQPRYGPRAPRPQKLDPYRAYLRGGWRSARSSARCGCCVRFAIWGIKEDVPQ